MSGNIGANPYSHTYWPNCHTERNQGNKQYQLFRIPHLYLFA
ncbi:hypothetical protein UUU_02600 [Klebsiella pneumoniae subsp. pneumoniae DSM 30104 = JCM 1662 = NBRC 14940]|nr:hypothetical protein UUU_02600 [Klebsiella pneumoniae subsp. pneumoniae DSM 30104 = JCM 1662 = NBRC 14940]